MPDTRSNETSFGMAQGLRGTFWFRWSPQTSLVGQRQLIFRILRKRVIARLLNGFLYFKLHAGRRATRSDL